MPRIHVAYYKEDDGSVPVMDFTHVPDRAQIKIIARIERLRELGHELRRPEADLLRDGIYELRTRLGTVNYRILYFFHGRNVAVLSHATTKENEIPNIE